MVARKKRAMKEQSGNGGAEARALAVVVEEQRAQFKVFGEALEGVREEMNGLREDMNGRFEAIDRRFDGVDREIAFVKSELSVVKTDLSVVKTDLSLVKTAVVGTNRDMKELRRTVEGLDVRKADRDELTPPPAA
jgi:chromosome segregation ATPase